MKSKSSHFYQNHIQKDHEMDFDNVKILDRANNDLKLQYKEMLYIRKRSVSLSDKYTNFLFNCLFSALYGYL